MEGKPGRGQPLTNKRSAPAYFDAASSRFNQQAKGGSTVLAKISCIIFSKSCTTSRCNGQREEFSLEQTTPKVF